MSDLIDRANEFRGRGQDTYARGLVNEALKINPNNTEAWSMAMELATSDRERKRYQEKLWQAMEGKVSGVGLGPFPTAPMPPTDTASPEDEFGDPQTPVSPGMGPSSPAGSSPFGGVSTGQGTSSGSTGLDFRTWFTMDARAAGIQERDYRLPAIVAFVLNWVVPFAGLGLAGYWLVQARRFEQQGVPTSNKGCLWALFLLAVIALMPLVVAFVFAFMDAF